MRTSHFYSLLKTLDHSPSKWVSPSGTPLVGIARSCCLMFALTSLLAFCRLLWLYTPFLYRCCFFFLDTKQAPTEKSKCRLLQPSRLPAPSYHTLSQLTFPKCSSDHVMSFLKSHHWPPHCLPGKRSLPLTLLAFILLPIHRPHECPTCDKHGLSFPYVTVWHFAVSLTWQLYFPHFHKYIDSSRHLNAVSSRNPLTQTSVSVSPHFVSVTQPSAG